MHREEGSLNVIDVVSEDIFWPKMDFECLEGFAPCQILLCY